MSDRSDETREEPDDQDRTIVGESEVSVVPAHWHQPREDEGSRSRLGSGPSLEAAPDPEVGDSLGRYLLVSRLGEGGMGVVYEAYDPELDRKVAIKILRAAPAKDASQASQASERARAQLVREAQSLAQLAHPNIVAIFDVGRTPAHVFLAMELVVGTGLDRWIKDRPRSWREVVEVFTQAAEGLAAAHRSKIVHHDFKPENVLLGEDGRVRILDFGLAHQDRTTNAVDSEHEDATLTQTTGKRRVAGTPSFMAPEQHAGEETDERCDQYAFCVSLYEALYGLRPFAGRGLGELAEAKRTLDIREPDSAVKVPRWLASLVRRGLEPDPSSRHPSMAEIAEVMRRRSSPRARRAATVIGISAMTCVALALQLSNARAERGACEDGAKRWTKVWNPERKGRVREAFSATELPIAAQTFQRATATIDRRGRQWSEAVRDACRATHSEGTQSPAALTVRLECLRAKLDDTGVLIASWDHASARTVQSAEESASDLPDIDECEDPEAWLRNASLPRDPRARSRALELENEMFEAQLSRMEGQTQRARSQARAVVDESAKIGFRRGEASAHILLAHVAAERFRPQDARDHADIAMDIAEASGDDQLAARVAADRLWIVGYLLRDLEQIDDMLAHAQAHVDRAPGAREAAAFYSSAAAGVQMSMGRHEDAEELYRKLVEQAENEGAAASRGLGIHYQNLALSLDAQGRREEALALFRRAYSVDLATLGKLHAGRMLVIGNLAQLLMRIGHASEAIDYFDEAMLVARETKTDDAMGTLRLMAPRTQLLEHFALEREAAKGWQHCFDIHRGASGHDDPQLLISSAFLIGLHSRIGRSHDVDSLVERIQPLIPLTLSRPRWIDLALRVHEALMLYATDRGEFERALEYEKVIRDVAPRLPPVPQEFAQMRRTFGAIERAHLELRRGNCGAAIELLDAHDRQGGHQHRPGDGWYEFDYVLALEACGRISDALARLDRMRTRAARESYARKALIPRIEALTLAIRLRHGLDEGADAKQALRRRVDELDLWGVPPLMLRLFGRPRAP